MKNLTNKIEKYFKKIRRDGFLNATKKAYIVIKNNYLSHINVLRIIKFYKHRSEIIRLLNNSLYKTDYDRIIIWRSSIGWNIPLYQRPQHLSKMFSKEKCLVLYEVTKLTDLVDFVYKENDNLLLINYDIRPFVKLLNIKLKTISKPKYLFTASTCWDLSEKLVNKYMKSGYKFLYDYLDELSPKLAGTDSLPYNVQTIHNYVINNIEKSIVICTADTLYKDMINKRKSDKNIIFSSNGVRIEDFKNLNKKIVLSDNYKKIVKSSKPIIGYYGALASWFDYDLIKKLAKERPEYNIVLIGTIYDTTFNTQNLEEFSNIYFLGPKKYVELPYYAKHFNVCILPFILNEITVSTSPIKVFEYMALSKPIVTTALNECKKYKSINIAHSSKEFIELIDKMINIKDKTYFNQLLVDAKENTWESKSKKIINGLQEYEKTASFVSMDDVIEQILFKVYLQNYNTDIKSLVNKNIRKKKKTFIITINSETCMYSKENDEYKSIVLNNNVLLVPDSISISYVMKKAFNEKVLRYPGIDLLVDIFNELNKYKKTVYLYGSTFKVNKDMVKYVKSHYNNINVVGNRDGYIEDDSVVEEEIIKLKPDLIVVALGIPKQELFINRIYNKLHQGIMIGVGGSFDVLSGNQKRAPKFMRRINMEWLYRVLKNPQRFNRFYNNNVRFIVGNKKRSTKK